MRHTKCGHHLIGGSPVVTVTLAGITVDCLVDTGSQVSLISEAFFRQHIQPSGCNLRSATNWLTIRGVDGLKVPYIGYFKKDITVSGMTVPNRAVLVVRDTEYKRRTPGLLGMNILSVSRA